MRTLVVFLIVLATSVDADDQFMPGEPDEMDKAHHTGSGGGGLITPMCDAPASNCIVPRPALQPHLRSENEALDLAECYLNCLEMVSSREQLWYI